MSELRFATSALTVGPIGQKSCQPALISPSVYIGMNLLKTDGFLQFHEDWWFCEFPTQMWWFFEIFSRKEAD
jgi:hypothetical protein